MLDVNDEIQIVQKHPTLFTITLASSWAQAVLQQFLLYPINDCSDAPFRLRAENPPDVLGVYVFVPVPKG